MTGPRDLLARIKARADEATPGPWEAHDSTVAGITGTGDCGGCSGILSPAHEPSCYWSQIAEAAPSDAEFIAHSRSDVPRLAEALEAALGEHTPRELDWWVGPERFCHQCMGRGVPLRLAEFPCPTVRAIETALNEEEA